MINANDEIFVDQTTSCTIDDALLLMLGITIATVPESVNTCLDDILDAEKDQAEADYIEAKAEKLSDELIKAAFNTLEKADRLCTKAQQYRCDIIDELAKQDKSELRIDPYATINPASPHITLRSLNQWALKKYKLMAEIKPLSEHQDQKKPWLIVDPRDPQTSSAWFTPARYFARQLIKENTNLLHKKEDLTKKIAKSLGDVGIYKRGGKEPPDSSTILKALSNVKLG
jgi:hypothetical protein